MCSGRGCAMLALTLMGCGGAARAQVAPPPTASPAGTLPAPAPAGPAVEGIPTAPAGIERARAGSSGEGGEVRAAASGIAAGAGALRAALFRIDPALWARLNRLQSEHQTYEKLYAEKARQVEALRGRSPEQPGMLRQAQESLDRTRKELENLDARLLDVQREIVMAQQAAVARVERLLAPFKRPVSVEMKDATLRQAAQALSKVSGTAILVDESVPEGPRLRLTARGVALGAVLEAIAAPLNLELTSAPAGLRITRWPSLKVNEDVTVFTGPHAPWSEELIQEWGFRPTFGAGGFPGRGAAAGENLPFGGPPALLRPGIPPPFRSAMPAPPAPGSVEPRRPNRPDRIGAPAAAPAPQLSPGPPAPLSGEPPLSSTRRQPRTAGDPLALAVVNRLTLVTLEPLDADTGRGPKLLGIYRFDRGALRRLSAIEYSQPGEAELQLAGVSAGVDRSYTSVTWKLQDLGEDTVALTESRFGPAGRVISIRTTYRVQDGRLAPIARTASGGDASRKERAKSPAPVNGR